MYNVRETGVIPFYNLRGRYKPNLPGTTAGTAKVLRQSCPVPDLRNSGVASGRSLFCAIELGFVMDYAWSIYQTAFLAQHTLDIYDL